MKKVPVQKGAIVADQPTMKHMTVEARAREDAEHHALRRSGQSLEFVSPMKNKK